MQVPYRAFLLLLGSAVFAAKFVHSALGTSFRDATYIWTTLQAVAPATGSGLCHTVHLLCSVNSLLGFLSPGADAICDVSWCSSRDPVEERLAALERAQSEFARANHRNFASIAGGARILDRMTHSQHGLSTWCRLPAGNAPCGYDFMLEVLREGPPIPGECWTFKGSQGHITVHLAEAVNVANITINNIPAGRHNPSEASKAPRDISVWGLIPQETLTSISEGDEIRHTFAEPRQFSTSQFHGLPSVVHTEDRFIRLAQFEYGREAGL